MYNIKIYDLDHFKSGIASLRFSPQHLLPPLLLPLVFLILSTFHRTSRQSFLHIFHISRIFV